jgi:hypothetical protein
LPDETFLAGLRLVFVEVEAHVVSFFNPLLERDSASTVYVAWTRAMSTVAPKNEAAYREGMLAEQAARKERAREQRKYQEATKQRGQAGQSSGE